MIKTCAKSREQAIIACGDRLPFPPSKVVDGRDVQCGCGFTQSLKVIDTRGNEVGCGVCEVCGTDWNDEIDFI
jgi:hypothetical protein